ncbi:hypothetical protein [Streptomyces sp. NPDC051567]|uniref:hypothetical protein n=1 Tax=Streptomyces sp. NPDC051567 TaxID=3365660 RepID=UPI0037879386
MPQTDLPRPRRRLPRAAVGLSVLLVLAGYVAVQRESSGGGAPYCTATAVTGADASGRGGVLRSYEMTSEQASNAATVAAVGIVKGLPDRAVTIALATVMQESALRNIRYGDRDSLGLFQQRPSQGWGTPAQIMDPVYSAGIFYDRLAEVPGYAELPLTVAAQKVQRSGFPDAYAKHEPDAAVLTAAFGADGTLACSGPAPAPGDPARVAAELARVFGGEPAAGGDAPGTASGTPDSPAASDAVAPDAARTGETELTVRTKRGGGPAEVRRGRVAASWAVARARELGIARVSYGESGWTGGQDWGRWRRADRVVVPGEGGPGTPEQGSGDEVRIFVAR